MQTEIKEIQFDGKRLIIRIKGHPSQAINKGHNLASIVLNSVGSWRFTAIQYFPPHRTLLASDGVMYLAAELT